MHKGEPININTLQIRILNPDRTPVLNLGTDNSLFLKLSQQILTNLEIQTKELLGMQEKPVLLKDKINEKIIDIKDAKKNFEDNPAPT